MLAGGTNDAVPSGGGSPGGTAGWSAAANALHTMRWAQSTDARMAATRIARVRSRDIETAEQSYALFRLKQSDGSRRARSWRIETPYLPWRCAKQPRARRRDKACPIHAGLLLLHPAARARRNRWSARWADSDA